MRILITGAAGYIGTALANYYAEKGASVTGFDNMSHSCEAKLSDSVRLVKGDLRDSSAVKKLFESWTPDIVSHHAAHIDPRESWKDPDEDAFDNVIGTINLLNAMSKHSCKRLIFASSCAVYGDQAQMDESSPYKPNAPYGAAKAAAEIYLEMYSRMIEGNRFVSLRYPNIYGAHQSGKRSTGVVAIFSERFITNSSKIDVLYNEGKSKYMYLRIEDLCSAHDSAVSLLFSAHNNFYTTVNLPGFEASVSEIHSKIGDLTGQVRVPTLGPKRIGEQESITMTGDKARAVLGWEPSIVVEEGLSRTVKEKREELAL